MYNKGDKIRDRKTGCHQPCVRLTSFSALKNYMELAFEATEKQGIT